MNIYNILEASYILVPIDEAVFCLEDNVSIKELLQDIEENVELEENSFSTLFPFNSAFWATYNETCYQVAINEKATINGEEISSKRQAAIQILKIILERSSLKDKISVYDYKMFKINLNVL